MHKYLFPFIIFLFVYFTQIQCNSTEIYVPFESTMGAATMTSIATSPSSPSSLTSTATSTLTSNVPNGTDSLSLTSPKTVNSSTYATSMGISTSTEYSTSPKAINSSTYATSMDINISTEYSTSTKIINSSTYVTSMDISTSTEYSTSPFVSEDSFITTPQPIIIRVNLIYEYNVESSSQLKLGNTTNPTVLESVQMIVRSSFNLTDFNITVTRVEIRSQAKTFIYEMFTDNLFSSNRTDCDETCIKKSQLTSTPTGEFTLQAADGSLVNATVKPAPLSVSTDTTSTVTTAIVNYQKGESPPGLAGQLGMGLGITFMGIIVIGLIAYLYRKYGFNKPRARSEPYLELTPYQHQLPV